MNLVLNCEYTGNIGSYFINKENFYSHKSVKLVKFDYIMFDENTEITYSRIVKPANFAYGKAFRNGRLDDITKDILDNQGIQIEEVLDHLEHILDNVIYVISYNAQNVTNILLLEILRLYRVELYNKLKNKKWICIESTVKKIFPNEYSSNDVFAELGATEGTFNKKTLDSYRELKRRKNKIIKNHGMKHVPSLE